MSHKLNCKAETSEMSTATATWLSASECYAPVPLSGTASPFEMQDSWKLSQPIWHDILSPSTEPESEVSSGTLPRAHCTDNTQHMAELRPTFPGLLRALRQSSRLPQYLQLIDLHVCCVRASWRWRVTQKLHSLAWVAWMACCVCGTYVLVCPSSTCLPHLLLAALVSLAVLKYVQVHT